MPRVLCVFAFVLIALPVPRNAAAQQRAGDRRPNLRVIGALPESQLFPLMNLIADSLGVRCDYCHVQATPDVAKTPSNMGGWVWDRDDKPQKRTAREMMAMTIALNAGHFGGESRVTCYTCHRGSTQTSRTPPLPPAASMSRPAPLPLPSIETVWTTYVRAVGTVGADAPDSGTIMTGWDDRPEGRYARIELVIAGNDRYSATISSPDGVIRQGLDGAAGWIATKAGVQNLPAADIARARSIAMRYRPVKERPANLQVTGVDRIGDHDCYVATAKIDSATTRTLYFDVVTGLLRREMTTTETLLVPLLEQVDYDDYREVDGVQLPFHIQTSDGAPYATLTRTFLQIRRNVPVDSTIFRPPR